MLVRVNTTPIVDRIRKPANHCCGGRVVVTHSSQQYGSVIIP